MTEKIMIFIPMYNCENQIQRVLSKIDHRVQNLLSEVVVVDNRSSDQSLKKTQETLAKLQQIKATILKNDENYSLGGSIKVAFNYAIENGYSHVITLHGDDQGDIRDLLPCLESGEYKNHDLVIGARFHKDSKIEGYSKFRTVGNRVFNMLYSFVTGLKIDDMIAGLNIFNVSFLKNRFYLPFPNNLTFDAHLLLYAIHKKQRITFVPIIWREEDQVSNAKVFRQGIIILKLLARYFFKRGTLFDQLKNTSYRTEYPSQTVYFHDPLSSAPYDQPYRSRG